MDRLSHTPSYQRAVSGNQKNDIGKKQAADGSITDSTNTNTTNSSAHLAASRLEAPI